MTSGYGTIWLLFMSSTVLNRASRLSISLKNLQPCIPQSLRTRMQNNICVSRYFFQEGEFLWLIFFHAFMMRAFPFSPGAKKHNIFVHIPCPSVPNEQNEQNRTNDRRRHSLYLSTDIALWIILPCCTKPNHKLAIENSSPNYKKVRHAAICESFHIGGQQTATTKTRTKTKTLHGYRSRQTTSIRTIHHHNIQSQ